MNLLDRLADRFQSFMPTQKQFGAVTPTGDRGWSDYGEGAKAKPTFAQLAEVGYRTNPWVNACISLKANFIASLPYLAVEMDSKNEVAKEYGPGADSYDFFFIGSRMPFRKMMNTMVTQLEIGGEVYPYRKTGATIGGVPTNKVGTPRSWIPMLPNKVTPIGSPLGEIERFEYLNANGKVDSFTPEEMTQISYPDPTDYLKGVSPLEAAYRAANTNNSAETWIGNLLDKGDIPAISWETVYSDGVDTMAAWEHLKTMLRGLKSGRTSHILGDIFKPNALNAKPVDMKLSESQKDARRAICAVFKVPAPIAGDLEDGTYSNYEQAVKSFASNCLDTAYLIIDGFNAWVAPQFKGNVRFVIDEDAVEELKENANDKSKRDVDEVTAGILTPGEVREARGLDRKPGDDKLMVDNRRVPLEDAAMVSNEERSNPITEE